MRRRVNWFDLLQKIGNQEMFDHFFTLYKKLRRGKSMSANRCAYNVLRNYYSTTSIDQLCKELGI